MSIRLSGMNSGLDTDSIIQELVKANRTKVDSLKKGQTKLKWQQDAWKTLNSKIYSFYTKSLGVMRFSANYQKKATTSSNESVLKVTAGKGSANGVQSAHVEALAKSGRLTGGKLRNDRSITEKSTLSEIGAVSRDGTAKIQITVGGTTTDVELSGSMTVRDAVNKFKEAGVEASFDVQNQRFFISAKQSGVANDFTLSADNAAGSMALAGLGLLSGNAVVDAETTKWANMKPSANASAADIMANADFQAEVLRELQVRRQELQDTNTDLTGRNSTLQTEITSYEEAVRLAAEGIDRVTSDPAYEEANATEGHTVADKIANLERSLENAPDSEKAAIQEKIDLLTELKGHQDSQKENQEKKVTAEEEMRVNTVKITANEELLNKTGVGSIEDKIQKEYVAKVNSAYQAVNGATGDAAPVKITGEDAVLVLDGAKYTSESNTFNVNGSAFTAQQVSAQKSDGTYEEVTLSTQDDFDGIYDMIKGLVKEYNGLMNEMDKLYGASSSKGYEPLTSEEKEAMSEKEIEEWEKKIKDSLFRSDSTISSVTSGLYQSMTASYEVGGRKLSLSDFGIAGLGYFGSAENEKHALHIDGDPDNENTASKPDKLKTMLTSDPETVVDFFTKLSENMYQELKGKMGTSSETRSIYKVYNDKAMQKEYDDYTKKILEEEKRLTAYEDKWYSKFSAMETALAKLQSKEGAISGLLGM